MEGQRWVCTRVFGYWGRVMKKKKKKKEKRGFMGRERIHAGMVIVSLTWCSGSGSHKKYRFLSDEKLKNSVPNVQGLGSLGILSDK